MGEPRRRARSGSSPPAPATGCSGRAGWCSRTAPTAACSTRSTPTSRSATTTSRRSTADRRRGSSSTRPPARRRRAGGASPPRCTRCGAATAGASATSTTSPTRCARSPPRAASALLLSPLHAPAPTLPQEDCPYYPSSRRWLNPLLLADRAVRSPSSVDNTPGRADRPRRGVGGEAPALAEQFEAERGSRAVAPLGGGAGRRPDAVLRVRRAGRRARPRLARSGRRTSATRRARRRRPARPTPRSRRATSGRLDAVAPGRRSSPTTADAAAPCALIGDLAVGCSPDGADAWIHQDLFAHGVTHRRATGSVQRRRPAVGPRRRSCPWRLRQARYRPFIAMLRAALLDRQRRAHRPRDGAVPPVLGARRRHRRRRRVRRPAAEGAAGDPAASRPSAPAPSSSARTSAPSSRQVRTALADAGMLGTKVWMFDQDVDDVAGAATSAR